MNIRRLNHSPRSSVIACGAAATLLMLSGCNMDIENPNAPDAARAYSEPAGLEQVLGGAFRTWVETRGDYFAMPLNMMADNYTASWNNAAIRYYSSVGSDCTSRCGWNNSATAPEAAGGPSVESQWYGYYTVLSGANSILAAIKNGTCFDTNCAVDSTFTSRNKAIAKMLQGMAMAGIAMMYDQGFVVDENTDISNVSALPFVSHTVMRDSAVVKLEQAFTQAGLLSWSTEPEWMGVGAGRTYTNTQIRQLIRTMQAEVIAMDPRDAAENAAVNWASVTTYAAAGISSGTPFDFEYYIDATGAQCGLDCVKTWGNSIGTVRIDTRVASMLTSNHVNPWPFPGGNPCPTVSLDRRVGDGSWGPTNAFNGYATTAATANAGTDYACSGVAIFPPARGSYHQSNLSHIRYQHLAYEGENLPGFDGTGQDPFFTRHMNDLMWAEGELRRAGGSFAVAATRINNTRVTRGNLTAATAVETQAALLTKLQYEQEIEFMGQGYTAFFNRRRVGGLIAGTPFHMPVPAKELDVLQRAVYTFGGPSAPAKLVASGSAQRRTVKQIHEENMAEKRINSVFRR